jgi:two-component system cell cycle response regulator
MDDGSHNNRSLQRQLRVLLDEARRNEDKLQRLQALELLLLGAESLSELIQMLLHRYREDFTLDAVSLVLLDPHYEIRRFLEDESSQITEHPNLIFKADCDAMQEDASSLFPKLGAFDVKHHSPLFNMAHKELLSVALLPLVRQGRVMGCLNLGSSDSRRFVNGSGTDLLERLTAIISICLENTLNVERLKHTGLTDALTGINNRRFFDQRICEEIERARRHQKTLSCLFVDIDYFKKINDSYGHQNGDKVLRSVAALLNEQMRRSDILARYGGEEFAILLCNTNIDAAEEIAERLRLTFHTAPQVGINNEEIPVSVSIGVATTDPKQNPELDIEQQADSLIARADKALYEAKKAGRNRVCLLGDTP